MRTMAMVLAMMAGMIHGWAQTPDTNRHAVITTNVWTTMPWYREVDGKVYDSKKWKGISGLAELKEILPDAAVWQICALQNVTDSRGGTVAQKRFYGKKFMVKHQGLTTVTAGPGGFEPTGKEKVGSLLNFNNLPALSLGTTNYNGETMALWDCGEKVKSPTVTIISTNEVKGVK